MATVVSGGRSRADRDREFGDFYAARGARMRALAYLLCGDWHLAEDVTQTAFVKLYKAWDRIVDRHHIDQYVRQVITRAVVDERRRPWRRERVTAEQKPFDAPVGDRAVEERIVLQRALARLPARQRATLVLRFWEDMSVDQTAELLGVTGGTVKSQTARGLRALRDLLGDGPVTLPNPLNGVLQ